MAKILTAMAAADTFGHPDLFGEYAGMGHYYRCEFPAAMKYFRIGARYADKLSQFTIGVMYLDGQGVRPDPVAACAWMDLAAERQYPDYVTERNRVCGSLSSAERGRAQAAYARLLPEYGDRVAMHRMAEKLLITRRTDFTGSRVGFDFGETAATGKLGEAGAFSYGNLSGGCGKPAVTYGGIPIPVAGCAAESLWSPWYWNPKTYFAVRDGTYGRVSVGNLKEIEQDLENSHRGGTKSTTH